MTQLARITRLAKPLALPRSTRAFSAQIPRMAEKSSMDANKGSVGSAFKPDGAVGGKAQEVGGPFDKDGAVGKQFTEKGAIGGNAQAAAEQAQGDKPAMFDKDGAVGKHFQADGAIGSVGEAVGGPFSSKGAIGKEFTDKGSVGGAVQNNLGEGKK